MTGNAQLVNPDTGGVFGFTLPLPAIIADQVARGILIPQGVKAVADDPGDGPVPRPRGNASQEQWVKYALSQGMPEAEALTLTRNRIRARFTAPVFDPDLPPVLED